MVKNLSATSSKGSKKGETLEEKKEEVKQPKVAEAKNKSQSSGKDVICFYGAKNPNGFMSNFHSNPINLDGKVWPTTEHYFQAMKFPTRPEHQEKIRTNKNPVIAKRCGRAKDGFRPDWESAKDNVMYKALVAKFTQHPLLAQQLDATGEALLVEHTTRDKYWGDGGDGGTGEKGRNTLGRLLVRVRAELRQNKK